MDTQTHYDVLGVAPTASPAVIKAAHRALAKELHPDRPGGDAEKFAAVNRATEVLLDPAARARYDADLEAPVQESVPVYPQEAAPEVMWEEIPEPAGHAYMEPAAPAPSRMGLLPGWARVIAAAAPLTLIVGTPLLAWPQGLVTAVIAGIALALGWARITRPAWALVVVVTGVVLVAG